MICRFAGISYDFSSGWVKNIKGTNWIGNNKLDRKEKVF